jgi:signal transduction histidine kinase
MRADMALSDVALGDAWAAAVSQHDQTIRETGATIHLAPHTAEMCVRAHPATLIQVLANLLHNALKFVPPGVAPVVHVSAERRDDRIRLWIADNGLGIPPEYHEKIFRVFERLHGKTYAGTGVGLAIVRTGMRRMGGDVGLDSELGKGARFWIELPAADPVPAA